MARSNTSMNIVLGVVNTGLYKGLQQASNRVSRFAAKMKATGSAITSSFTIPFALVAGASVKMAMDFERSMMKVQTLVLGTAEDMDKYSQAVQQISSVTAISAEETAEGLYFLTSAGLRGANALDTLMTVNKGVAIGLGESTDLAKVAAAAQNAYGEETITATEAIDAFGMAVRTGMFESSELAESLGTQVGMAAELGISFKELLANIATYTKTTGDARNATVGFGGVMMAFAKETGKGREALSKVNMSYEGLRQMLQDRGLAETLFTMKDAFEANGIQMTEFFGKAQAVKNVMGTLGEQGENYKKILDDMGSSADFTQKAFDELAKTPGFKMEKSINNIKLDFQKVGDTIMPVVEKIIKGISLVIGWFMNLDTTTKTWALTIIGVMALSGPLLSFFGLLASVIAFIISPIGLVIAGLVALGSAMIKNWDIAKSWIAAVVNYFIDLYNESMVVRGAVQLIVFALETLFAAWQMIFGGMYDIIASFARSFKKIMSGIGKVIKGVLTFNWKTIKAGAKDITKGLSNTFKSGIKKVQKRIDKFAKKSAKNWKKAYENTLKKEPIEFVTENDIQRGVDQMGNWAKRGIEKVKNLLGDDAEQINFEEMFGETPAVTPPTATTTGTGTPTTGGGDDTPDRDWKADLEKQKSAIRTHLEQLGGMWGNFFNKQDQSWKNWGAAAQAITMEALDVIGDMLSGLDQAAQQRTQNEMIREDNRYQKKLENLKNEGLSEKEFNKRKRDLEADYEQRKSEIQTQAAKREKRFAIFQAIINTAAGIAKAIPNPYLMTLAAVVGGLQVAAIKSQPIPMARGALAFSPTNAIVGDNPNAMNDPEVIAPLSKLEQILGKKENTVRVVGSISGNEIVLSSDKANISLARYA